MNLESNKALHTAPTATEIETLGWQTLEHVREVLESIQIQVPPMHTEPFIVSLGKLIQIVEENTLLLIFHNKNTEAQLAIQQCIRLLDNLGFNKDIPVLNPQALEPKFFPKRASKKLSPTSNPSMAPKHSKVTVTSTPNTHEVKTSWIMSKSINSFNKTMFTLPRAAAKKLGEMFVLYKGQRLTSELAEEMGLATYSIEKLLSGEGTPMYGEDVLRLILGFYVNTLFESDVVRKQLSSSTIFNAKREARLLMGQITEGLQETPIADSISHSKSTIMNTVQNSRIEPQKKNVAQQPSNEITIAKDFATHLNAYLSFLDMYQELSATYGTELVKLQEAQTTIFHVAFLKGLVSAFTRKLASNEVSKYHKRRVNTILKELKSLLPDDTGVLQADNTRGVELGMTDMWTIQAVANAMNITRENFSSILNATTREAAILNSVGPRSHETDRTKMISETTLYNLFIQSKDKLEDTDNTCQKFQKLVQNKIGHLLFKGNKLPIALSSSNEEGEDLSKVHPEENVESVIPKEQKAVLEMQEKHTVHMKEQWMIHRYLQKFEVTNENIEQTLGITQDEAKIVFTKTSTTGINLVRYPVPLLEKVMTFIVSHEQEIRSWYKEEKNFHALKRITRFGSALRKTTRTQHEVLKAMNSGDQEATYTKTKTVQSDSQATSEVEEDSNEQEFSEPDVPSKVDKQKLNEQTHTENGLELRKQKAYNVLAQSILSSSIASLGSLKETLEDDLKTSAPQLLAMAILQGEAVYTHICSFPIGLRDNTTGADHLLYIKQCIQGAGMKIEESIDTTRKVVSIFAVALPY